MGRIQSPLLSSLVSLRLSSSKGNAWAAVRLPVHSRLRSKARRQALHVITHRTCRHSKERQESTSPSKCTSHEGEVDTPWREMKKPASVRKALGSSTSAHHIDVKGVSLSASRASEPQPEDFCSRQGQGTKCRKSFSGKGSPSKSATSTVPPRNSEIRSADVVEGGEESMSPGQSKVSQVQAPLRILSASVPLRASSSAPNLPRE